MVLGLSLPLFYRRRMTFPRKTRFPRIKGNMSFNTALPEASDIDRRIRGRLIPSAADWQLGLRVEREAGRLTSFASPFVTAPNWNGPSAARWGAADAGEYVCINDERPARSSFSRETKHVSLLRVPPTSTTPPLQRNAGGNVQFAHESDGGVDRRTVACTGHVVLNEQGFDDDDAVELASGRLKEGSQSVAPGTKGGEPRDGECPPPPLTAVDLSSNNITAIGAAKLVRRLRKTHCKLTQAWRGGGGDEERGRARESARACGRGRRDRDRDRPPDRIRSEMNYSMSTDVL
jgi:hypothetical protein